MSADTIQNQAPLFIVFDGMDGTGKTTQMRLLCDRLTSLGMETVLTCEPSTSPDGQALRRALSGKARQVLCAQAWKPSSQQAGEKRGVAGLLLGRTVRAARASELQLCAQAR